MKGAFAAALGGFQSLGSDESRERPVDRLAALGASQIARAEHELRQAHLASLGVDLIAFKFGGRKISRADAEDKLALILAWPTWWTGRKVELTPTQIDTVAWWAVTEWADDRCPPRPHGCGGALEVPNSAEPINGTQPMMVCAKCGGVGKRKWTDRERSLAMGETHPVGMDHAHRIIAFAESFAMRRGMEMLERR